MAEIPRESWLITNISKKTLTINDIVGLPPISPNQTIDLLEYAGTDQVNSSVVLNNYIRQGLISIEPYFHTHDDKADIDHKIESHPDTKATGKQLNTLVDGSNADNLHIHENLNDNVGEIQNNLDTHIESEKDVHGILDVQKIIYSTDDISKIEGLDATNDQINKLISGDNTDLHTHLLINIIDITATKTEINRALRGTTSNVTASNLNILTGGGNANGLHNHGSSGAPDHNDLNGLFGSSDYYHLSTIEKINFDILVGGGSSNADSLHSHSHNNLTNLTWSVSGHTIDADILPATNNLYDLGSPTLNFSEAHTRQIFAVEGTTTNATITDTGIVSGIMDNNYGLLTAGKTGSLVLGSASFGSTIQTITDGIGSIANGVADSSGIITASGSGSIAKGIAFDGGLITASGGGSFAQGSVDTGGIITASGNGSIASGDASGGEEILASGSGSIAIGSNGDVKATNINTAQFGIGTNNTANSLQVGSGVLLEALGDITATGDSTIDGSLEVGDSMGIGNVPTSNTKFVIVDDIELTSDHRTILAAKEHSNTSNNTGLTGVILGNYILGRSNGLGDLTDVFGAQFQITPKFTSNNDIDTAYICWANLNEGNSFTGNISELAFYGAKHNGDGIGGTVNTMYGLLLPDITFGTTNYAIKTGLGDVSFGDDIYALGNVRLATDTGKLYFGLDYDCFMYFNGTDLNIGFSNPSTCDLDQVVRINDDLIVEGCFALENTVWDDLRFPAQGNRMDVSAGRLDYDFFNGAIGYQQNARYPEEPVSMIAQMPHEWKEGSIIRPHIHWIQRGSTEPNWLLAYKIIPKGQTQTVETDFSGHTLLIKTSNAFTYTAGSIHQITNFGDIDMSLRTVSDIVHFVLFRDNDDFTGLFGGSDSGITEYLTEFDVHYQIDTMGSNREFIK